MPTTLTVTTTENQPAQQLALPTRWADVTLAQYLAAHAGSSPHAPALRLSGLPDDVLDSLPNDAADELAYHMAFASNLSTLGTLLPTPGLLEIGRSAHGLYKQAEQYRTTIPDAHPLAFGAYLYALYHAPTGSTAPIEKVAAAHAAVLAQPLPDVYADCQYFLASWARVGQRATYIGAGQPGILRVELHKMPASGLLSRLTQQLPSLLGNRRAPRTSFIA